MEQKIEQPGSTAKAPDSHARIFSMPERYRHGAQAKMHEEAPRQPISAPQDVKAPAVPAPKAPPKPQPVKRKISSTKKILLIGGIAVLLLGAGGYALVLFSQEPVVQTPSAPSTATRPAPEPKPQPEPESTQEEEPEPQPEPDVFPVEVTPGTDSDSDGLTDTEENLVYGTDPKRPDSDSDGFLDGNEVFHGYNPDGIAPGTLVESGLVDIAKGSFNGILYQFSYPSVWDIEEEGTELMLDAQTGEGFRISATDEEMPEGDVRTTKQDLSYVLSDDQLTAYVDLDGAILKIQYDTAIKSKVDYLQTFQMMLNTVLYDTSASESVQAQGGTETAPQTPAESP